MPFTSSIYAIVARERRRWYASRPGRRRRLAHPVVSVGSVAVGGSGKTPVAGLVARMLLDAGHRPAILTRGYGRAIRSDGVTIVSDGHRVLADLDHAGDEPLMLARQVAGVPVLVSADRYAAGRLAETRLGCTVHVLDDGFQHFALEREIDLVLLSPDEVDHPVTLPAGRLREPIDVARAASALIVGEADGDRAEAIGRACGVGDVFRLDRRLGRPWLLGVPEREPLPDAGARVVAVAGIARPGRFFAALEAGGWTLADRLAFADHRRFTRRDLDVVASTARNVRADLVVTTEKDAVRMEPLGPLPIPVAVVPLRVSVEPAERFGAWLLERLGRTR